MKRNGEEAIEQGIGGHSRFDSFDPDLMNAHLRAWLHARGDYSEGELRRIQHARRNARRKGAK